jgi:ribosomal protein S18 acetylase RimI-like enzyme
MTAPPRIERAGPAQVDAAAALFQAYLRFYGKSVDPARSRAFIEDRLEQRDSVFLIAWDAEGRRALGFTQLYPAFASLSLAPNWILNDLYVEPDARGQGVATALMNAARQLAMHNGAAEIFLQTAHDNEDARALYEKLGYVRDEDFVVYTLKLPRD